MTVVAVVFGVSLVVAAWMVGRVLTNLQREHDRHTGLLINQLMHLAGRTWEPPPSDTPWQPPADVERWTPTPEQYIEI